MDKRHSKLLYWIRASRNGSSTIFTSYLY